MAYWAEKTVIRVWGGHGIKNLQDRISKKRESLSERVTKSVIWVCDWTVICAYIGWDRTRLEKEQYPWKEELLEKCKTKTLQSSYRGWESFEFSLPRVERTHLIYRAISWDPKNGHG